MGQTVRKLRKFLAIAVLVLFFVAALGTLGIVAVRLETSKLLAHDARMEATGWATRIVQNVDDFRDLMNGELSDQV